MIRRVAPLLSLAVAWMVSGCATGQLPLEMQVADEEQVFRGEMNLGPNVQDVHVQSGDGSVTCKGVSLLGYASPSCTSVGSFRLDCTDGRVAEGDWKMEDCAGGAGTGTDSRGNAVRFLLGDRMRGKGATASQAGGKAIGAGNYRFHFADRYAAGFTAGGDPVVFEDPRTGLVIVELSGKPVPMSLTEAGVTIHQEAFVLLPQHDGFRVVSVTLQDDASGSIRIANKGINGRGLPVFDIDGKVLGLTVALEGDVYLFTADHLRRYLGIVAPSVAAMPAVPASARALQERITTTR